MKKLLFTALLSTGLFMSNNTKAAEVLNDKPVDFTISNEAGVEADCYRPVRRYVYYGGVYVYVHVNINVNVITYW